MIKHRLNLAWWQIAHIIDICDARIWYKGQCLGWRWRSFRAVASVYDWLLNSCDGQAPGTTLLHSGNFNSRCYSDPPLALNLKWRVNFSSSIFNKHTQWMISIIWNRHLKTQTMPHFPLLDRCVGYVIGFDMFLTRIKLIWDPFFLLISALLTLLCF